MRSFKLYSLLLSSALGLLALIALGAWQLERHEWKRTLLADIEHSLSASAEAFDIASAELQLKDRDYLRVDLRGRFDHPQERYLFAVLEGQTGWQVITPFITDDHRLVLVNRGFVPDRLKDPRNRPEGLIQGETNVTGLLRKRPRAGMFTPANQPSHNIWYWLDLEALTASLESPPQFEPSKGIVQALPSAEARYSWPKPIVPDPSAIPNNHLQYAFTWFALAGVLLVMTVILLRSSRDR